MTRARDLSNRASDFVSVKDFGAVGNGVTDDTTAVQNAVDYCIANNKDLSVDGMCLLSSSVNINRLVDNTAYDQYFTIFSNSGGGFKVSTAIPMFSSSLPFSTTPVSQLVRFSGLWFTSTDSSLNAYVLDDAKFLRTRFDGCSFTKIRLLTASTVYTQSIYLTDCNIRRFTGIFFNSGSYTYDFKMVNCLIEAGVTAIKIKNPVGCSVVSSCIEGQSGTAISYDGAQGLDITGCYFEGNGLDVDGTYGGASSSNSYGVCLNGNMFANSTPTYTVKWYNIYGGTSVGNFHTGYMHNLTGSVNNLVTYDFAQSSLSAQNLPTIRSGYDGTFVGALSGVTAISSATVTFNTSVSRVNWTSHGLSNGNAVYFTTTGTLPTGITANTVYYVINATQNDFQITSLSYGFVATSPQAVTFTVATSTINCTGHGYGNGGVIYFTTSGTLPTGITAYTNYYVVNSTANTFQISSSYNGSAITLSGIPSGTSYFNGYNGTPITLSGTPTGTNTGNKSTSATFKYNKVDNSVTLYMPDISGTSNSTAAKITGLPSYINPPTQQIAVIRSINNGVYTFGLAIISSNEIALATDALGNAFTASGTKGMAKTTITYSLS